jgi:hypothetical protein
MVGQRFVGTWVNNTSAPTLFLKHHFPEKNLRVQSEGLARMIAEIGPVG